MLCEITRQDLGVFATAFRRMLNIVVDYANEFLGTGAQQAWLLGRHTFTLLFPTSRPCDCTRKYL